MFRIFYIAKMVMIILAILLVTKPIIKLLIYIVGKTRIQSLKLSSYLSKISFAHISGISTALILCLTMLGTLLDFSYSFKSWAGEVAENQLSFHARITTDNNALGTGQLSALLTDGRIKAKGVYFVDVCKISKRSSYIMTEISEDNELAKIYSCRTPFNSLKENEAVLTKRLLSDLGFKIGDMVKISLNGIENEIKIIDAFNTMDYSSYIVIVSNDFFEKSNYKYQCSNIKLIEGAQLKQIKSDYRSALRFSDQDELALQWKNSVISGVDMLLYITILILISLILMLRNSINNSILNRKQDFAVLRTIGVSKNGILKILFTELLVFQLPNVLLSIVFSPVIAYNFVALNVHLSGYHVVYKFDFIGHIIAWGIVVAIIFIIPIRIFVKAKNLSQIESFKLN